MTLWAVFGGRLSRGAVCIFVSVKLEKRREAMAVSRPKKSAQTEFAMDDEARGHQSLYREFRKGWDSICRVLAHTGRSNNASMADLVSDISCRISLASVIAAMSFVSMSSIGGSKRPNLQYRSANEINWSRRSAAAVIQRAPKAFARGTAAGGPRFSDRSETAAIIAAAWIERP